MVWPSFDKLNDVMGFVRTLSGISSGKLSCIVFRKQESEIVFFLDINYSSSVPIIIVVRWKKSIQQRQAHQ